MLRPDHRPRAALVHPQRAPPRQQIRRCLELPLRGQRGRGHDEARGHRLAVVHAQVHRRDRDDHPEGHPAGSADLLIQNRRIQTQPRHKNRANLQRRPIHTGRCGQRNAYCCSAGGRLGGSSGKSTFGPSTDMTRSASSMMRSARARRGASRARAGKERRSRKALSRITSGAARRGASRGGEVSLNRPCSCQVTVACTLYRLRKGSTSTSSWGAFESRFA
mmetsp:Transcript_53292/g.125128  ORF Transcript_53292/g.125128 Transcript_53292/m.125128 type:complete len:220 (+) Transcript_53292:442-1101(+)